MWPCVPQALGNYELAGGRPTYAQLDALIVKARQAKMDIFDVARQASSLAIEASEFIPSSVEKRLRSPSSFLFIHQLYD